MRKLLTHAVCSVTAGAVLAGHAALAAAPFTTVYRVPGTNDGASPYAALIKLNGAYFGTSYGGGDHGRGTVFKIDAGTGAETVVYSFQGGSDGADPEGALTPLNGFLYGTTAFGGPNDAGTVFKLNPRTGAETVLYRFPGLPGGYIPTGGLVAFGGMLYGTTSSGGTSQTGTLFKIDPESGAETSLYMFGSASKDGEYPSAGMIAVGATLYGTTGSDNQAGGGTIYSFDPATNVETPLYFLTGSDGLSPGGPLLDLGGVFYGTASQGAFNDNGTAYSFNPATSAFSVLYSFQGQADGGNPEAGLISASGVLYGTTDGYFTGGAGSVFALDLSSGTETTLHSFTGGADGGVSTATLLDDHGLLIGTAQKGGDLGLGVVFSLDPASKKETVLRDLTGVLSGSTTSGLTRVGTALNGSTTGGGAFGYGTVFQVDSAGGAGTVVYSFKGRNDGLAPSGMLATITGTLYGTTQLGGPANLGTVFSLDTAGNKTTLHSFAGADGASPQGGLVVDGKTLYGTTALGGRYDHGAIFSIQPDTGAEAVLYSFTGGADGGTPLAPLAVVKGTIYGSTEIGGTSNAGVLFALDTKTGKETTVFKFDGPSQGGASPLGQLTNAAGTLYGSTADLIGEPSPAGTVFSLTPATGDVAALHLFANGQDGNTPFGGVLDVGGLLYGTTGSSGLGYGTVFSLDIATRALSTLYSFTGGADGGVPRASLVKVGVTLWGTTGAGAGNAGTVFKLKP